MMIEAFLDRRAPWLSGEGPEASVVLGCQCSLLRNLADFPFPVACTDEDARGVEARAQVILAHVGLAEKGQYWPASSMSRNDWLVMAERRLALGDFAQPRPHGGIYVAEDQECSISVLGSDHICMSVNTSGLQCQEAWARLNLLDSDVADVADLAFSKRFGFLTSSLEQVGTGLRAHILLHLPALTMNSDVAGVAQLAHQRRQALQGVTPMVVGVGMRFAAGPRARVLSESIGADLSRGVYGDIAEAKGDLYVLTNEITLGMSEEEILFHLKHTASEVVAREHEAREQMFRRERIRLEDSVARALGVAQSARLLGFSEALSILSALRLGLEMALTAKSTLKDLNELLLSSQSGHIKTRLGRECDDLTLNIERADLFRARFG